MTPYATQYAIKVIISAVMIVPPNGPTSFVYQVKNPFRFSAPMDDSTAISEQET